MLDKLLGGGLIGQLPALDNINQLIGGTIGGQLIDSLGGQGGQGAALGGLAALLGGQQQGQQQGAQSPMIQPDAGIQQGGQMAMQPLKNAGEIMPGGGQSEPQSIDDPKSRMARVQRAMRAADAAKSGDIMSLVETLIMMGD